MIRKLSPSTVSEQGTQELPERDGIYLRLIEAQELSVLFLSSARRKRRNFQGTEETYLSVTKPVAPFNVGRSG
ncbi:uncharacterized protein TrAFT101_006511 [Trichoderma asperellum]|uniref:uncharacterized protein n=1 Tax=Trichoderma asperellum TaxID=101201 RepID=UPI00331C33B5|nr:hypothetical protein TrAFT101_006511 [Trichoderma asperellum]